MSARALDVLLRAAAVLLGAMWIVAAASTLHAPADAFEFTVRTVGTAVVAKPVLTAWVALEAGLGVAMAAGALRGFLPTAALLGVATAALALVKSRYNGTVKCGCMGLVADESVDQSLARNGVLLAVVAALAAAAWITSRRRRAATPAPAAPREGRTAEASGPATRSP